MGVRRRQWQRPRVLRRLHDHVRRRERPAILNQLSVPPRYVTQARDGRWFRRNRTTRSFDVEWHEAHVEKHRAPRNREDPPLWELQPGSVRRRARPGVRSLRRGWASMSRPRRWRRCLCGGARTSSARSSHRRAGRQSRSRLELLLQRTEHPSRSGAVRARVTTARSSATRVRRQTKRCSSSHAGTSGPAATN